MVQTNGHYIVAVGASAGGLEAINELFDNMPSETGFSFVIIQHLSPDHKSLMGELLSKHTSMKVFEAQHNMALEPNCIYLIPSKKTITISGNKLRLEEKIKTHLPNNAIDIFFESLAEDKKGKAVGIVLSGTGTDGTKGLKEIKEKGGFAIVQDPISASFDGMPNSAISLGVIDLILPPEMIPDELVNMVKEGSGLKIDWANPEEETILYDILQLIRRTTEIDYSHYKRPTILRRLSKRMAEKGISSLHDYHDFMMSDQEEIRYVSKDFLINVTKFFRDPDVFERIRTQVLPIVFTEKKSGDTVKIWVVACSTGEEAYSIAILFQEYIDKHRLYDRNVKIFATDIDEEALEFASRGCYTEASLKDVPKDLIKKYFIEEQNGYRINNIIRKMVVFAHHNVFKDPPYSRIDIVSCRNMLIYMGSSLQASIMRSFHFSLNQDGFLVLGPSENIGVLKDSMREIDKKWKIYQCVTKTKLLSDEPFLTQFNRSIIIQNPAATKSKNALSHLSEIFKDILVEEQKYAGIFIDKQFEVKQAIGNYKSFMNFPEEHFNFNLLKMLPTDLSIAISTCVRAALKDNKTVSRRRVKVYSDKKERTINVIVRPYTEQTNYVQSFLFIVLNEEESRTVKARKSKAVETTKEADLRRLNELEDELRDTRENLQAVIEEVESTNEELQSSNEEIISSNEELQSTNEELQSLNEELHTVNAEHQLKIRELIELNDDLNNYFRNTDIGQILIDKKMVVRKFTPAIKQQINLIESDIGRSIIDISNNFRDLDFINDVKGIMRSGDYIQKNVVLQDGRIYLMKIGPYIKEGRVIDGVVVSFVDISEVTRVSNLLGAVLNNSNSGIIAMKSIRDDRNKIVDFELITSNKMAAKIFRFANESMVGRKFTAEFDWIEELTVKELANVVETGHEHIFEFYNIERAAWFDASITKMMDGVVATITDITEKKLSSDLLKKSFDDLKTTSTQLASSNEKLEQSNLDLLQFASIASHDLKEPLRKIQAFGNILQTRISNKLDAEDHNYFQRIIKASNRMQTLIEDVLTLSKLSNNELQYEKVDLNSTITQILDDIEISIREKNAVVQVEQLPVIEAVPGQMHQLFQNLISNALKFNENHRPCISITRQEVGEILNGRKNQFACIRVQDNGIGFDQEFKEKIFGIFQRLNGQKYTGSGIGLAICKKIVENHKGYILPQSEINKGSYFDIILPLMQVVENSRVAV